MSKFPEPTISDLFKQKLHEVFVRNELGDWDKAFKISHAKIGDSGYSFGPPQRDLKTNGEAREYLYKIIKNYTPGEKLGLKFTPPVIAISNSIIICINKHTS